MKIKKLIVGSYQTNCYVVYENKEAFIIDPGSLGKKIHRFIQDNELNIKAILITHGHLDHIGAIDYLYPLYHCPIYIHKDDMICLKDPRFNLSGKVDPLIIQSPVLEMPDLLNMDPFILKFHHLPGHSQGSGMIEVVNQNIIFSGDVLFKESIGRFDFFGSSKRDTIETIKKLKEMEGDYTIYPGHDEITTLKYEQLNNPYLNML